MRATNNILRILSALSQDRQGQHYALQLSKDARVNVGTVYAVLDRLETAKYVNSSLEAIDPAQAGRPQRRYYQITQSGQTYLDEQLQELRQLLPGVAYA